MFDRAKYRERVRKLLCDKGYVIGTETQTRQLENVPIPDANEDIAESIDFVLYDVRGDLGPLVYVIESVKDIGFPEIVYYTITTKQAGSKEMWFYDETGRIQIYEFSKKKFREVEEFPSIEQITKRKKNGN